MSATVALMTTPISTPTTDDAARPPGTAPKKRMAELWSEGIMETGYTVIPTILLWGQGRLGLSNGELAVLAQLISHRWVAKTHPHPSKERIAARVGRDPRTVQRLLTSLEKRGFLARITRTKTHKGQDTNGYDLTGLVAKLDALAPEFKKVLEMERLRRAAVERPRKAS